MKKIAVLIMTAIIATMLFTGCGGAKASVTVQVERGGEITIEKTYKTDVETLEALVVKYKDELGASYEDSDFGKFVTGMDNYTANAENNEFFEILVNDISSQVGMAEIKIADGDIYLFRLSTF